MKKENRKYFIVIILFFAYQIGNYFYIDYSAEKSLLEQIPALKIIKEKDNIRYEKILKSFRDYEHNRINENTFRLELDNNLKALFDDIHKNIYKYADESLIIDYSKALSKITTIDTNSCYDYFYGTNPNQTRSLPRHIKMEFFYISDKLLLAYYNKNKFKIIDKKILMEDFSRYLEPILKRNNYEYDVLTKNEHTLFEKKQLCKIQSEIYSGLIEDKKVDMLRYILMIN